MRMGFEDRMPGYNPQFLADLAEKRAATAAAQRAYRKVYQGKNARLRAQAIAASQAERMDDEMALIRSMAPLTPFQRIERRALLLFRITRADLHGRKHQKKWSEARQFVAYWAYRLTKMSMPQIGRLLGGRDHTSVLAAIRAYRVKRARAGRTLREAR
jgi:chromosomal replication initiation ATPase DnaA